MGLTMSLIEGQEEVADDDKKFVSVKTELATNTQEITIRELKERKEVNEQQIAFIQKANLEIDDQIAELSSKLS